MFLGFFLACAPTDTTNTLFAVGDSYFDFYADEGKSIPQVAGDVLNMQVQNNSISGALITWEDGIATQYEEEPWPWLLVNGGGNDANEICGCEISCFTDVLQDIASEDGTTGELVSLIDTAISNGSNVALALYMPVSPEAGEGFSNCGPALELMTSRYQTLVDSRQKMILIEASDIISFEETPEAYHEDNIHPSIEGSRLIGEYIADKIMNSGL